MFTGLPLLFVWHGPPDEREWSPTGINSFLECQRKWAWKKIAKVPDPGNAGTDLGKRSHAMWERYLGTGERPDFVADKEAAAVASLTLHLLPQPRTPGMQLERHFRFKSAITGHVYHGFKDFELPPGVPQPQVELDGSVPIVGDHKTTKKIDEYAKTADDLQDDAQAVLYALDAMARHDAQAADLFWPYAQTKGAKRSQATVGRLHRAQALKVFNVIEQVATEASAVLDAGLQPLDLPPTIAMCREYGGCPYQTLCNLSPSQKARSRMSNSVIANLRARVQGAAAVVQETPVSVTNGQSPVDTKPSVMGCSDKDVPAPTEIPAAFLAPAPAGINPPEGQLAAPPIPPPVVEEPKPTRTRRTKAQIAADNAAKDPKGADAHAHATPPGVIIGTNPPVPSFSSVTEAKDADAAPPHAPERLPDVTHHVTNIINVAAPAARDGFTLYVDCIPVGRATKTAASLIEKAQERISKEHGVPDYRLIDFGKGVPFFIAFVDEQVDGTFDLALDTRTPEGEVLLETLTAKASFVVRGFR